MPIENKFERCEPDDPNRCQASGQQGQCPYKAVPKQDGTYYSYCPRHLAGTRKEDEKKRMRNYRLGVWQARMEEFADNDQIKSLREEIGITRVLLEEVMRACGDSHDIIMASNKISDLTTRIEKLVSSCHRLEQSTGMLLDKTALLKLADTIVGIIGNHIEDKDKANTIGLELMTTIMGMQNEETGP